MKKKEKYFFARLMNGESLKGLNHYSPRLILAALLIAAFQYHGIAQPLTLENAVNLGLKNNERIKQFDEKFKQKSYEESEAWGNFLPSVNLVGSYNHLNDPLTIDLDPIRQAMIQLQTADQVELANVYSLLQGQSALTAAQRAALSSQYSAKLNGLLPSFTEVLKQQDYKSASLVAVQPLFMGGKLIAAKNYASAEKRAAEIELRKTQDEVVVEVVDNYLAVVLLSDVIKTREDVLKGMQHHESDARKMFNEGLIGNHHLLRAEVAVAEAERNLSDDQNRLSLAMLSLKHSLGIPGDEDITINDSLVFRAINDSISTMKQEALRSQPILRMIAEKKDAASQKQVVERSEFLPTVAAFGKYEMYPQYLSIMEPRWVVGVQVSLNLFNGFKNYNRLESAVHLENEVEYMQMDLQKKVDLWVEKANEDVINAAEKYRKLESNKKLGEENLRVNTKRFETGLSTSLEVIDAQLSLEKILIDRESSLYDYYKSVADLYQAAGVPQKVLTIWNAKEN
jgi:outer membrane protein TolC